MPRRDCRTWQTNSGFRGISYTKFKLPEGVSALFMLRHDRGNVIRIRVIDKNRRLKPQDRQQILGGMHGVASEYGYIFSELWNAAKTPKEPPMHR